MNRLYVLVFVALLGVGLSLPGLGEAAITVLDIEPGVRAMGIGGAAVALVDGAETIYHNPAGLADLEGFSVSSFYSSHLGLASYSAFAVTFRNWGLAVLLFNSGNIQGFDVGGNPIDAPLSYGSHAVLLGFGVDPQDFAFIPRLPIDFSIGGRIVYVSTRIGDLSGSGFALDLAYRMTFPDLRVGPVGISDLALGLTATNLLGRVNYGEHSEDMATSLRLGGAARIAEIVLLSSDIDLAGRFHFGVEYEPIRNFALRAGMLTQPGGGVITLGLGINVEGFRVDYAYITNPGLAGSHRVSLSIDFAGIDINAIMHSLRRILP